MSQTTFKRKAHAAFFKRCLMALPASAQGHDPNRVTIAFFCLAGLDLLGVLDPTEQERQEWTEWIWSLQSPTGGFRGSPYMTTENNATSPGHVPSTYTALTCLALLEAPLDRLDRPGLLRFLRSCQAEDGSFAPVPGTLGQFQNDARMSYTVCVARAVALRGGSSEEDIDVPSARAFINSCRTWEGGYSSRPGIEAQGGTTYCSISALTLLGGVGDTDNTVRWLAQRQLGGFQGRPGKLEDVCYSFWCGGALAAIGKADLVNSAPNTAFLLNSQSPIGGFGKEPGDMPDPFHSYLALAALALTPAREELGLKEIDAVWNIPPARRDWLLA